MRGARDKSSHEQGRNKGLYEEGRRQGRATEGSKLKQGKETNRVQAINMKKQSTMGIALFSSPTVGGLVWEVYLSRVF